MRTSQLPSKDLAYYLQLKYPVLLNERDSGRFFATHPALDGCMAEGDSMEEVLANLADARELWIEARLEGGYPVPEPTDEAYSGRISLRMPSSLHASLAAIAQREGVSLNLLINRALSAYSGGLDALLTLASKSAA